MKSKKKPFNLSEIDSDTNILWSVATGVLLLAKINCISATLTGVPAFSFTALSWSCHTKLFLPPYMTRPNKGLFAG